MMNKMTAYLQLMRFDRPTGFLLLLWPTVWALWIAGESHPPWRTLLIFSIGVMIMRAAGCVINDIADRHIDGKVTRTRLRPLVTKAVTVQEAWTLFILLCLFALILVLLLHQLTVIFSFLGLLLVIFYPFAKRVMPIPQLVLGLAFAWSIPMVFVELTQHVPLLAWILFVATVCWTMAYDTQYAMADRPDDIKIGIYSSAILFGRYECLWIGFFQTIMVVLLFIVGYMLHKGLFYYLMLLPVMGLALYQYRLISRRDRVRCTQAFKNNHWIGAIVFLAMAWH